VASKFRSQLKPNDDRRLKKLTYQLKFLREESLERNEFLSLYRLELREALSEYLAELGLIDSSSSDPGDPPAPPDSGIVHDDNFDVHPKEEDGSEDDEESEDLTELKKLYRKIVTFTHPDKVQHMTDLTTEEKLDRAQIYRQACEAFELRRMDDLIELAVYLGIDVDIPTSVKIDRIQNQIDRITTELDSMASMIEWVWGNNFGNNLVRARILGAVCHQVGVEHQDDEKLIDFISRYDSEEARANRRKVGTRPERRGHGEAPKRRE